MNDSQPQKSRRAGLDEAIRGLLPWSTALHVGLAPLSLEWQKPQAVQAIDEAVIRGVLNAIVNKKYQCRTNRFRSWFAFMAFLPTRRLAGPIHYYFHFPLL